MTSFTSIEFSAPISSASESSLPAALSIGLHMLLKTRHCQISFECMRKAKAYLCFRPPGGGSGQPDPCGDKVEQLLELIHVHHHKSLLSGGACIQLMQAGCCYRILLSAILNLLSLSCPWWLWQSDARYGRSINNCPPLAHGPSPVH